MVARHDPVNGWQLHRAQIFAPSSASWRLSTSSCASHVADRPAPTSCQAEGNPRRVGGARARFPAIPSFGARSKDPLRVMNGVPPTGSTPHATVNGGVYVRQNRALAARASKLSRRRSGDQAAFSDNSVGRLLTSKRENTRKFDFAADRSWKRETGAPCGERPFYPHPCLGCRHYCTRRRSEGRNFTRFLRGRRA